MTLILCFCILQEPTIQDLLRDLGAESIEVREKAEKTLAARGDAVEVDLRRALETGSPEAKGRIAALIRLIEGRRNGRILFNKDRAIWACNYDGADAREVFAAKSCALQGFSWSPDQKTFCFASNKDGTYDVFRSGMDLKAEPLQVDVKRDYITRTMWSPDGATIAFAVDGQTVGTGGIYVVGRDGAKPRRLTDAEGWDGRPSWSPKGDRLALSVQTKLDINENGRMILVDRKSEVEIIDVATGKRTRLTKLGAHVEEVAWSPDGAWIAFSTEEEVFRISPDGGDPKSMRKGSAERLAWSPDGRRLGILTMDRPSVGEPFKKQPAPQDVVAIVPLQGETILIGGRGEIDDFDWSRCGSYIVRVDGTRLLRTDDKGGNETLLAKDLSFFSEVLWGGKR